MPFGHLLDVIRKKSIENATRDVGSLLQDPPDAITLGRPPSSGTLVFALHVALSKVWSMRQRNSQETDIQVNHIIVKWNQNSFYLINELSL